MMQNGVKMIPKYNYTYLMKIFFKMEDEIIRKEESSQNLRSSSLSRPARLYKIKPSWPWGARLSKYAPKESIDTKASHPRENSPQKVMFSSFCLDPPL